MSTNAATRSRSRASGRRMSAARRRSVRRRRIVALLVVAGVAALAAITLLPNAEKAVQELALPLRHEDIIRQQSADKGLDPSLVAGIIYAESRFRDATSHAGATRDRAAHCGSTSPGRPLREWWDTPRCPRESRDHVPCGG